MCIQCRWYININQDVVYGLRFTCWRITFILCLHHWLCFTSLFLYDLTLWYVLMGRHMFCFFHHTRIIHSYQLRWMVISPNKIDRVKRATSSGNSVNCALFMILSVFPLSLDDSISQIRASDSISMNVNARVGITTWCPKVKNGKCTCATLPETNSEMHVMLSEYELIKHNICSGCHAVVDSEQ